MSDNLSQIGRVDPSGAKIPSGGNSYHDYSQGVTGKQAYQRSTSPSEVNHNSRHTDSTRQDDAIDRTHTPEGVMDIGIQYKIDKNTNEITIVILDKTNQRIIRTIPAEDIAKFKDKGLFELFA